MASIINPAHSWIPPPPFHPLPYTSRMRVYIFTHGPVSTEVKPLLFESIIKSDLVGSFLRERIC